MSSKVSSTPSFSPTISTAHAPADVPAASFVADFFVPSFARPCFAPFPLAAGSPSSAAKSINVCGPFDAAPSRPLLLRSLSLPSSSLPPSLMPPSLSSPSSPSSSPRLFPIRFSFSSCAGFLAAWAARFVSRAFSSSVAEASAAASAAAAAAGSSTAALRFSSSRRIRSPFFPTVGSPRAERISFNLAIVSFVRAATSSEATSTSCVSASASAADVLAARFVADLFAGFIPCFARSAPLPLATFAPLSATDFTDFCLPLDAAP